jgi:hypothetical protein
MLDDFGDVLVVFDHLLVVAAALVGRARAHCGAHEDVDLGCLALTARTIKQFLVFLQKLHIGLILGESPQGTLKV